MKTTYQDFGQNCELTYKNGKLTDVRKLPNGKEKQYIKLVQALAYQERYIDLVLYQVVSVEDDLFDSVQAKAVITQLVYAFMACAIVFFLLQLQYFNALFILFLIIVDYRANRKNLI